MNRRKKTRKRKTAKRTYTTSEYNSGDGMLTAVWGPSMWHVLHTISFNYPVEPTCDDKRNYRELVYHLKTVLPCGKCRNNFCKNLAKLPLTWAHMKSRATFSKYMYDLHELVNTMLHKSSGLSYHAVRERYEHFRARCTATAAASARTEEPPPPPKKEDGCTEPLYHGEKSKCVLQILPQTEKCETFQMDKKCVKQRIKNIV